jgi:hypothetical protein
MALRLAPHTQSEKNIAKKKLFALTAKSGALHVRKKNKRTIEGGME